MQTAFEPPDLAQYTAERAFVSSTPDDEWEQEATLVPKPE
jgi:hypothetical protein